MSQFRNFVANALLVVGIIVGILFIIAGIVLCCLSGDADNPIMLIIGLYMLFICPFLFALPICGFGVLVQDVAALKSKLVDGKMDEPPMQQSVKSVKDDNKQDFGKYFTIPKK